MRKTGNSAYRFLFMLISIMAILAMIPMWLGSSQKAFADDGSVAITAECFPDANFRNYLEESIDSDKDGILSQQEIIGVHTIDVENRNISNLTGLKYFKNLSTLNCDNNSLTSIDVSSNPALEELNCAGNQLTALDVGSNQALQLLNCEGNHLTYLDLSSNSALSADRINCIGQTLEVEAVPDETDSKWTVDISFIKEYGDRLSNLSADGAEIEDNSIIFNGEPVDASITYDYDTKSGEVKMPVMLKVIKHTHVYDQEIASMKTACMPASCMSYGVYYKSCICGSVVRKYNRDNVFYTPTKDHTLRNKWDYDEKNHWHFCEFCHENIGEEAHIFGDWVETKEPTYLSKGTKERTCSECDYTEKEDIPALEVPASEVPEVLNLKVRTKGKTSAALTWTKVKGASGYEIYCGKCSTSLKKIKTTKSLSYVKKGLKKGSAYKFKVRAYKTVNGKKTYITSSYQAHAITGGYNSKYTDARSIKASRTSLTISTGKTAKVSAKLTRVKNGRKFLGTSHAPLYRYKSGDASIASVNGSGKITAKHAGTCKIYIYAQNGLWTSVNVTVK